MIVSFLQGTPNSHFFLRPPQGAMLTYAFGPRTRWHGHKVREILVTIARGEEKPGAPISFFVDPANKTLTGFEWTGNGKVGYAVYTGQKKNPNLPLALGQAPKPKPGGVVVDATKHTGAPPAPPSLLAAGTAAPDFTVEDATGKPLKLSDFRGKVVVLDFWATWCGPCIASLPHTNTVARKFKDKDVVVVALNVMDEKKAFAAWLPKNRQYDALVFAIDPRGRGNNVAHTLYQVSGIPTQYVIDKDGRIVKGFVGYGGPTDDLENAIAAAQAKDKAK
jgi:thiol-disulfide isomerase/thioredoxin